VVVVLQDDAPAGPYGADHVPHDLQRLADVLENEARVREIERAPFVVPERRIADVAQAQIEKRMALRPRQLLLAALDADQARAGARAMSSESCPRPQPKSMMRSPFAMASSRIAASFISR